MTTLQADPVGGLLCRRVLLGEQFLLFAFSNHFGRQVCSHSLAVSNTSVHQRVQEGSWTANCETGGCCFEELGERACFTMSFRPCLIHCRAHLERAIMLHQVCDRVESADVGQNCLSPFRKHSRVFAGGSRVVLGVISLSGTEPCMM